MVKIKCTCTTYMYAIVHVHALILRRLNKIACQMIYRSLLILFSKINRYNIHDFTSIYIWIPTVCDGFKPNRFGFKINDIVDFACGHLFYLMREGPIVLRSNCALKHNIHINILHSCNMYVYRVWLVSW